MNTHGAADRTITHTTSNSVLPASSQKELGKSKHKHRENMGICSNSRNTENVLVLNIESKYAPTVCKAHTEDA